MKKTIRGFTIVELLIVIVVIGILAAITIVAYNSVQARARDTARTTAVRSIQKALKLYSTTTGSFPATAPNPGTGVCPGTNCWEASYETPFLSALTTGTPSTISRVPLDPLNTGQSRILYNKYTSGFGCSASLGEFYILRLNGYEAADMVAISELPPSPCVPSGGAAPSATQAVFWGFNIP